MAEPRRLVVGPFNRVEGDLEVRLEINAGRVESARVNSPLYRGFEQILLDKTPEDALVFTPRICGICSVSQSVAAAYALRDLQGLEPDINGDLAIRLMAGVENLADHFTHYYLFFAPDFAREVYADQAWYPSVGRRYLALHGSIAARALAARAELLRCMGHLAGKWPHSLAIQPGGSTRALTRSDLLRVAGLVAGFRRFLESETFGDDLENICAIDSLAGLQAWRQGRDWQTSDLTTFLHLSDSLQLDRIGRGYDRFLSYGAYGTRPEDHLMRRGVWDGGAQRLDEALISEDISHAWMTGSNTPLPPTRGVTVPDAEKATAYSWCKAPRLDGKPMETGALARQVVDDQPLLRDWVRQSGGSVGARVLARMVEMARVTLAMQDWLGQIRPGASICSHAPPVEEGTGAGLTEAARGALGHWLEVRRGQIFNYQIIAPTTWNFSPRDRLGQPGPLEKALVGLEVRPGETTPVAVQHVVRSFDPCMVCTVH